MGGIMLERSSIVKRNYAYPLKHNVYSTPKPKRRDCTGMGKAMTLIAGVRCIDGFVVAADTALSVGDMMFQGQKIDLYLGKEFRMVIACAGDMSCAQTAARQIHYALLDRSNWDIPTIVKQIETELIDVYQKHIYPRSERGTESLDFSLIIGVECCGLYQVLHTNETRVTDGGPYVFNGGGFDLAQTYAELMLRSRNNDALTIHTASTLHIVDEIFRTVKRFRAAVGLDTRIYAWRCESSAHQFYELGKVQKDFFWRIQENLKWATWAALEPPESEILFNNVKEQPRLFLEELRKFTENTRKWDGHFVCYTSIAHGESRMKHAELP